jgi:hypothetical protein
MSLISRLSLAIKAARQLGLTPVMLNALYRFGLATGHYRRVLHAPEAVPGLQLQPILPVPTRDELSAILGTEGKTRLLAEADEILGGKIRLFGGQPVALTPDPGGPLANWTEYESGKIPLQGDVKFTWEPARFGWATVLARAFYITGNEIYAETFWKSFKAFSAANPPYRGPNWASAQEAALRIIIWTFAWHLLREAGASTPARIAALAQAIAVHAARIPPTLPYARSQNNNHLLSEASGLLTAGLVLPRHPQAGIWRELGRKWFNRGLEAQIGPDGEYVQHSTNYQRLMLQLALWVRVISGEKQEGPASEFLTAKSRSKLAEATRWLLALVDRISGQVPNLGPNDGAYMLPLASLPFVDYRPVVQAAARAFLAQDALAPGPWDEMSLWFGLTPCQQLPVPDPYLDILQSLVPVIRQRETWAYLRAKQLTSRPGHADQLHLDLWWRGLNLALDPGTYSYNAKPPWDNALTSTLVHNTVSVDGREQMTRVGRFLYLDWQAANATWGGEGDLHQGRLELHASQRAYGLWHRRSVVAREGLWQVEDHLYPFDPSQPQPVHRYRLHWLLPDWECELAKREAGVEMRLKSPYGWITLQVNLGPSDIKFATTLIRAGELLYGAGAVDPIFGWVSPTYGLKVPALSLAVEVQSSGSLTFTSQFEFPQ